jgi:hypothetical protein
VEPPAWKRCPEQELEIDRLQATRPHVAWRFAKDDDEPASDVVGAVAMLGCGQGAVRMFPEPDPVAEAQQVLERGRRQRHRELYRRTTEAARR